MKRRIRRVITSIFIIYIAGGFILYFIQDLLLFHPKPLLLNHQFSFTQPFEEINILIDHRNLSIIKFKTGAHRKGLVLFFHGNMENVEHYSKYPSLFTKNGYELWMIDYPGFGKSTGRRTEENMYKDALLMYEKAFKEISKDSLIIYGKSIGTGVASYLASERKSKRLILETPYYSIDALAKHYFPIYPVMPMTKYSFPINQYLKKVKSEITIFHGTKDKVVPYVQGKRLYEENTNIELVTIENGRHNNLSAFPLFQYKLDSLLSH
jgi:uncharacterized protein